ncbi:2OG-Fe(II) oxygenase [Pseudomonas entomophila]|uniref:2OG-Fe(II) oxygenase n=1 Tax=Pseudomonas entomophila TaxID=312306 RepID=UPI0023D884E5|nr:2OG-Fe(II) oxygenase [Pseudomonas entomophila]MDF0729397.1 2OG-Fe(II) oxygenase [Pseudomonas entomophila]
MRAMHTSPEDSMHARIVDDLAERGWTQQSLFLPVELLRTLADECRLRAIRPASVGRGDGQEVREAIRGDRIQWLEPGQSVACDQYLAAMDGLRQALNQGLYLGLEDYECHFALYPPGAFYRRHLDRFRDDDRRAVSVILYLNEDWQPEDGGQLRMFLDGDVAHDVQPLAGCLVAFLSADIPHEVLAAGRERLSLTGWFRRRGNDPF